jgi:integrase
MAQITQDNEITNPDKGLFKRGKRWYLKLYVPGRGKKVFCLKVPGATKGTTQKGIARRLARTIRRQIKSDRPEQVESNTQNLARLIEEFKAIAGLTAAPAQVKHNASIVERFRKHQKIKAPCEITPRAVQNYLADLQKKGRTPSTLWNHRASLSRFCRFLRDRSLIDYNPARETSLPKIEKATPVFLKPSQIKQALSIAKEHNVYAEIAMAIYTGLRRSELRRMEWDHVNYDMRTLLVPKSKSGKPRTVPLNKSAITVLKGQQKISGGGRYIFPGRQRRDQSGMRRISWWADAIKPLRDAMPVFKERQAETVGRGWHLLRHTFASNLAQRGVSIQKICEWLGHSDIRTTMIYSHLQPKYDRDIERLCD